MLFRSGWVDDKGFYREDCIDILRKAFPPHDDAAHGAAIRAQAIDDCTKLIVAWLANPADKKEIRTKLGALKEAPK